MARPLEGIRVLDATVWFQGPVCAQYLADMGAEVIHLERPVTGDQARGVKSIAAVPVADWNQYFLAVNRNKKSVVIDLKSEAGRELFYELVKTSDVVLTNFSVGVTKRLGIDHDTLAKHNPRIVTCAISGFGETGPNRFNVSFDMVAQGTGGGMSIMFPMVLMMVIFYFLLIRPQSKREKERKLMVEALKNGDSVVTRGGIVGSVQSVKNDTLTIRSLESKFEVYKDAVERVIADRGDLKENK